MVTEIRTKSVYWTASCTPEKQSSDTEYETNAFLHKLGMDPNFNVENVDVVPISVAGYTGGVMIVVKLKRR